MKKLISVRIAAALLLGAASVASFAVQRTFVASYGLDTNPCSVISPCRTFQPAINAVDPGGEVVALDSAGYGSITISKSVSVIVPPGVHAAIAASTGTAVTVSPGAADVVVLRGLYLNNVATASLGIEVTSGAAVHVENCVANGFTGAGIGLLLTGADTTELYVKDTIVRNTGGVAGDGIVVNSDTGRVKAVFDRVRVENSVRMGIFVRTGATATVRDSVIAGNGDAGLLVRSFLANQPSYLIVENTVVTENLTGLVAGGGPPSSSIMDVSNSAIVFNGTGLSTLTAGAINSRGNNSVRGNSVHGSTFTTFTAE